MNPTTTTDDLVKKLDLTGVPENLQNEIIAQLGENIITSVTLDVVSRLSDDDRAAFETLLQQDDSKGIEKFLSEKVPNIDDIVKERTEAEIEAAKKVS
jgi:hypothetical protein